MMDSAKNLLNSVEEKMEKLLADSDRATISEKKKEKEILEMIEMVVRFKYPYCKAYLFGSRISYLSFEDSDLDVYLDCENQYASINSMEECDKQLLVVMDCFKKQQDNWLIEEVVQRTRVPIIKLRHRFTNLNCDISFVNGLSVEKSKILG